MTIHEINDLVYTHPSFNEIISLVNMLIHMNKPMNKFTYNVFLFVLFYLQIAVWNICVGIKMCHNDINKKDY